MADKQTYDFNVTIGFRVEAANEHDALRAALNAENSLNEASTRGSYGAETVMRVKAPLLSRFRLTNRKMPNEPVDRHNVEARFREKLDPLRFNWRVVLRWRGHEYGYTVTAPTREAAIEQARVECYHKTSHMGTSLVSVHQEG